MMEKTLTRIRYPLMAAGMACLLAGIVAGLLRLNMSLFLITPGLAVIHGPLMVCGFVGTVISLERAVALGKPWGYLAPLLSALGGLSTLFGFADSAGVVLFLLASVFLTAIYAVILRRQMEMFNVTMALGAVAWGGASIFWFFQYPVSYFVLWWGGFLILTIGGERLELSRFVQPPQSARTLFTALLGIFLAGMIIVPFNHTVGAKAYGASMFCMAVWFFIYDIPRRTVTQKGLTRYVAVSLLAGYFSLAMSGLLLATQPGWPDNDFYDPVLHSLFLGFAFSMIFGHAPIIFPAVLKLAVPYSPAFYVHLGLLHISLALRVMASIFDFSFTHAVGGALNALAIIIFLLNTVVAIIRGIILKPGVENVR
ncbi:MAG: hypothetical protein HY280_10165 [Nitrospinae bacterium]|nr:hypothetical protein [Nitrospinota bacterium]